MHQRMRILTVWWKQSFHQNKRSLNVFILNNAIRKSFVLVYGALFCEKSRVIFCKKLE